MSQNRFKAQSTDGLASGADAAGQAILRQSEPTTKRPELLIVVVRDRWEWSRTDLLPAESPVMRGHELLGGRARGQSPGPTKHGLHGEVRRESAGPDGSLQRADVDVQLFGELIERQQIVLPPVVSDGCTGMLEHRPTLYDSGRRVRSSDSGRCTRSTPRSLARLGSEREDSCR
jgi:hypothetical protein